jgi:hypothetical protein
MSVSCKQRLCGVIAAPVGPVEQVAADSELDAGVDILEAAHIAGMIGIAIAAADIAAGTPSPTVGFPVGVDAQVVETSVIAKHMMVLWIPWKLRLAVLGIAGLVPF